MSSHLPRWLFDAYTNLFCSYGQDLFTFKEAEETLAMKSRRLAVVLSQLKKRGYMIVFGRRGRTRLYRLLSPLDTAFIYQNLHNLERVKCERYRHLIVKSSRLLHSHYRKELTSICLYGSVARQEPKQNSDVDLLVIVETNGQSLGAVLNEVYRALEGIADERRFLYRQGIYTDLSIFPMSKEGASRFVPLYLDIMEEGILLYDLEGFLENVLCRCRDLVSRMGGKRIKIGEKWFWRLDPSLRVGEKVEI